MSDPLLTAKQVVERWPDAGFSRDQLWRWGRDGLIDVVRFPSGRMMFRQSTIEALLRPVASRLAKPSGFAEVPELPGQKALL